MKTTSTVLVVQRAGVISLHLNGMEAFSIVQGVPIRRTFVYPTGTEKFGVRHLPGKPGLLGLVVGCAVTLFSRYPKTEGDHSRLLVTDEKGVIHSYLNGIPITLTDTPRPEPQFAPFLVLAAEVDAEFVAEEGATAKHTLANKVVVDTLETRLARAYDILVTVCGAHEGERTSFLNRQTEQEYPREWRFCGNLGFGGKFWRNAGRTYVACYKEDETPQRLAMIAEANRQLSHILDANPLHLTSPHL